MADKKVVLARPSTGIPKIDAEVQEFLKLKPRDLKQIPPMVHFRPPTPIDLPDDLSTIYVVGAGWNFPAAATALVATGAKVVAYEMAPKKIAKGQLGLTMKDAYFSLDEVERVVRVIPDLSQEQLKVFPNVIRTIANDDRYKKLLSKLEFAIKIKNGEGTREEMSKKYDALEISQKVSKREVIEFKEAVIEILKKDNKLKIVEKEVTIDMVESWLKANKPVFIITGNQVDLEKVGLDGIDGSPGFVKEFLLDTDDTENLIKKIRDKQQELKEKQRQDVRPKVAIVGGGASSVACAKDLLKRIDSGCLEIFWIRPIREKTAQRQSVLETQKSEKENWIPGHVAEIVFSPDQKTVESVKVIDCHDEKEQDIPCGLLVHTWNPDTLTQEKNNIHHEARQNITNLLDERKPLNGLVRDSGIGPFNNWGDITARIEEDWTVSIKDDQVLEENIRKLLRRKQETDNTIVVTDKNAMTEAVMALAESLGYDGHWYQVQVPVVNTAKDLMAYSEEAKRWIWHDVEGQVVKEGTAFKDGKFSLAVSKSKDRTVQILSDLDAVINCAGKSPNTPLIEEMKARRYIGEHEQLYIFDHLQSNRRLLLGNNGLFKPRQNLPPLEDGSPIEEAPKKKPLEEEKAPEEKDSRKQLRSLHVTYSARYPSRGHPDPLGWEENFRSAHQALMDIKELSTKE